MAIDTGIHQDRVWRRPTCEITYLLRPGERECRIIDVVSELRDRSQEETRTLTSKNVSLEIFWFNVGPMAVVDIPREFQSLHSAIV